jgi:hypothetical protein
MAGAEGGSVITDDELERCDCGETLAEIDRTNNVSQQHGFTAYICRKNNVSGGTDDFA